MSKPHKHADIIKAWADGEQIQYRVHSGIWHDVSNPSWCTDSCYEYRVKPANKTYYLFDLEGNSQQLIKHGSEEAYDIMRIHTELSCVTVIIDGETGKLKDIKILKK